MIELKDEELLLRLRIFEGNFVERKASGDLKDWPKTVVAFANSTPVGCPAVLFIGVKDDGTPDSPCSPWLSGLNTESTEYLSDLCVEALLPTEGTEAPVRL
jgi:predicted HTH transcriptional regulator